MAHTKSGGSTQLGRDSNPKYLGVKKHDGEPVKTGDIIIRQRGSKFIAGQGVKKGGDDTLFALRSGVVKFKSKRKFKFDGKRKQVKMVSIA